jgi:hypothetical protein
MIAAKERTEHKEEGALPCTACAQPTTKSLPELRDFFESQRERCRGKGKPKAEGRKPKEIRIPKAKT